MIDETIARRLQADYRAGNKHALGALYAELRHLAGICIKAYAREKRLRFRCDVLDEVSHTSAATIAERYMRSPEYAIKRFGAAVRLQVLHDLCQRPRVVPVKHAPENGHDATGYVEDILRGDHGLRALVDLAKGRSYRGAITAINAYAGRDWIYRNAVPLATVYRVIHEAWRDGKRRQRALAGS